MAKREVCEMDGCEEPRRARGRSCSRQHAQAGWRVANRAHLSDYRKRRRIAVEGRICRACLITDAESQCWSQNLAFCQTCVQLRSRNGDCAHCPRVLQRYRSGVRTEHCGPFCARCDAEALLAAGLCQVILLSPEGTPERERWLWRRLGAALLGSGEPLEVIAATPEQWRKLR